MGGIWIIRRKGRWVSWVWGLYNWVLLKSITLRLAHTETPVICLSFTGFPTCTGSQQIPLVSFCSGKSYSLFSPDGLSVHEDSCLSCVFTSFRNLRTVDFFQSDFLLVRRTGSF